VDGHPYSKVEVDNNIAEACMVGNTLIVVVDKMALGSFAELSFIIFLVYFFELLIILVTSQVYSPCSLVMNRIKVNF
jgi:hypothetical protein